MPGEITTMRKLETRTPRYDESGRRLTDCCGAFSTYMDGDILCCKRCYWEVPVGQGDGTETRDDTPAT